MDAVFIISGQKMHPHPIPSDVVLEHHNGYITLSHELVQDTRSVINIMQEEIYGLVDYTLEINGGQYHVASSRYSVSNVGAKLREKLTFILREESNGI